MTAFGIRPARIWAVGTLRNEVDLVRLNVLHHLSQGIDRFLLIDDGSTDGTREALHDLAIHFPIDWEASNGVFHQQELLTRLARTAAARGADWVLPVDADEFWCAPGSSIRQVLSAHPASALEIEVVNFVQRRQQELTGRDALLHMVRRVATPVGDPEEIGHLVESDQAAYVEIRYPSKWIARASTAIVIGWGNHTIDGVIGERERCPAILCLHAPLRSKDVLLQKPDLTRPQAEVDEYHSYAWHLRRWRRLAAAGQLDDEWQANSHTDGALGVLGDGHTLVEDTRLRDCVTPWVPRGPCVEDDAIPVISAGTRRQLVEAAGQIDGWFEPEELALLIDLVGQTVTAYRSSTSIVEVGSYEGRSTVALATAVKALGRGGRVYAVDPHTGEVGAGDGTVGIERRSPTERPFLNNLARHGVDELVEVVRRRSTDVTWRRPIHLLVIDGLHDYESVVADVSHFEPWLERGASVALHDYSAEFPGVKACVEAMLDTGAYVVRMREASLVVLQRVGDAPGLTGYQAGMATLQTRLHVMDETIQTLRARLTDANARLSLAEEQLMRCRASLADSDAARASDAEVIGWLQRSRADLLRSKSWRWTAPLRAALRVLRGR